MTQKKAIEVVIGQHRLTLKTDQDPLRVQQIADLVNKRLAEVLPFGQPISHQVLMLLAMNMADDLLSHEKSTADLKLQVKQRSQAILSQLEREFPL